MEKLSVVLMIYIKSISMEVKKIILTIEYLKFASVEYVGILLPF